MAYFKAKLKSSGEKASPCFRTFLIVNVTDTHFAIGLIYSKWEVG
jgi:hypothetical protein